MLKQLLLTLIIGCFVQYSTGDKCKSGANGAPDWSTIDAMSISQFTDITSNMAALIRDYQFCPVQAANKLGVNPQTYPCTLQEATSALCAAQTMGVMIDWVWNANTGVTVSMVLGNCIAENLRCAYYASTFLYYASCFEDELVEQADIFMSQCRSTYEADNNAPVPMGILLFADHWRHFYVENLDNTKLSQLLDQVLDSPTTFELFECDDKIDFMALIDSRGVADSRLTHVEQIANKYNSTGSITAQEEADLSLFLRFLPYFTDSLCTQVIQKIGHFLLTHVKFLDNVHFECSEEESLLSNITTSGESILEFYAAQENITKEALSYMYEKALSADPETWQCSSGCAERLVDEAMSFLQSLSLSNLETSLGKLVSCIDDSDLDTLISNVSPGNCQDLPFSVVENAANDPVLRKSLEACVPPNPATLTVAQIKNVGCSTLCTNQYFATQIPLGPLCTAIGTDMQWSCFLNSYCQTQEIVEYVIASCESRVSNIGILKSAVKAFLSFSEMTASITVAEVKEFATKLQKSGKPQHYIEAMIDASINVATVTFADLDYNTITSLSEEVMTGVMAKVSNIDNVLQSLSAMTEEISPISGGAIIERMMQVKTVSLTTIKSIPPNVVASINSTILESFMSCGAPDIDCIKALCKKRRKGQWSGVRAKLLSTQLKTVFETAAGGLDLSQILLSTEANDLDGACMREITSSHLQLLASNTNLLQAMCKSMADDKRRICDVPRDTRIALAKACFKYYNYDLDVTSTVLTKAVKDFGRMLLDIDGAVDLMDNTLFQKGAILKIAKCPHLIPSAATRTKYVTKLRAALDYNTISKWKFPEIGCWLPYLYGGATTSQQRTDIYKFIAKNVYKIREIMNSAEILEDYSCLKPEISETIKSEMEATYEEILSVLTEAAKSALAPVGRRRRSTVTNCNTAKAIPLEKLPSEMTVTVINAMADSEIATCLSYFGQSTGWSSEQALAILNKASTSNGWSSKSSLTSGNLITMGTIAYALTVAEINTVTIGDDSVSQLGSLHNWTDSQMQAIAARYLVAKSAAANTLTSQQLKLMMHAVCGVNSISQISPANYKSAANTLGQLNQAISSACLKSLASLATHANAYGQTSGWTVTTYNSVGTVAAGLTGEELNHANKDAIDAMGTIVSAIPPSELKKLSTAVLSYFNRQQVLSLTNDQLAVMNSDQRAVLESTSGVTITVAYSSAGGLIASFTLGIVALIACLTY